MKKIIILISVLMIAALAIGAVFGLSGELVDPGGDTTEPGDVIEPEDTFPVEFPEDPDECIHLDNAYYPVNHAYHIARCSACGFEFSSSEKHNYIDGICNVCNFTCEHESYWVKLDSTYCVAECYKCGFQTMSFKAEHQFVNNVCSRCGTKYHKHTYTYQALTEPTCTAAGVYKYYCSCGDYYYSYPAAHGHYYVKGICGYCGYDNGTGSSSSGSSNVTSGTCRDCGKPERAVCPTCGTIQSCCLDCDGYGGYCGEDCVRGTTSGGSSGGSSSGGGTSSTNTCTTCGATKVSKCASCGKSMSKTCPNCGTFGPYCSEECAQ